VQNASTMFRKKQSNYLKRESACDRDLHTSTETDLVPELRGYELRNQDILAASGAIPIKDSYDSIHDDIELVRLFQLYRSRHLLSDVFLNRAKIFSQLPQFSSLHKNKRQAGCHLKRSLSATGRLRA
jgi:hypothetical protein